MEAILEWMKGIVILFVVLSALMYLVPKAQYKKYIQFFMEMVLVIAVISPISKVIYASEDFEEKIRYSQFWQEMENVQMDVEKMDFIQSDYHRAEYETAIEEDIRLMAEGKEYEIDQIYAALSDKYDLESVTMVVKSEKEESGCGVEDISVDTIGGEESLAEKAILEQSLSELKKEIRSFYQLEEEQIVIRLEE